MSAAACRGWFRLLFRSQGASSCGAAVAPSCYLETSVFRVYQAVAAHCLYVPQLCISTDAKREAAFITGLWRSHFCDHRMSVSEWGLDLSHWAQWRGFAGWLGNILPQRPEGEESCITEVKHYEDLWGIWCCSLFGQSPVAWLSCLSWTLTLAAGHFLPVMPGPPRH